MSVDDNTNESDAVPDLPVTPKPAQKPQSIPPRGSKPSAKGSKPSPGGGGR